MPRKKVPAKQKIELERLDLAQRRSRRCDRGQVSEKLTYKHDKSSFTGKLGSKNLITTTRLAGINTLTFVNAMLSVHYRQILPSLKMLRYTFAWLNFFMV